MIVDVWSTTTLDRAACTRVLAALPPGERERLRRLRSDCAWRRSVTAAALVRQALGARLGRAPAAVRLGRAPCRRCGAPHGKPVSLDDPAAVHFNVSHAGAVVLVAAAGAPVGVDVEPLERAEHLWAARAAVLAEGEAADGPQRLLELWVAKEAALKQQGYGLVLEPTEVRVTPEPSGGPAGRVRVAGCDLVVAGLDVLPGYVAALASAVPATVRHHSAAQVSTL